MGERAKRKKCNHASQNKLAARDNSALMQCVVCIVTVECEQQDCIKTTFVDEDTTTYDIDGARFEMP
jgi:hypothetical protein